MTFRSIQPQRKRLADDVYDQLVGAIMAGDITSDDVLVQEKLAAEMQISRTPVREALMRLEQEGVLVASNRGVSVLPDWVVRDLRYNSDYITRPLTQNSITRRLYAATRRDDTHLPFMAHWLRLARSEPVKLQRGVV